MQKYPKKNLSNIYLLKIRNTKKIESKKKIHLNISKNKKNKNDRLLSFSFKKKKNFDNYSPNYLNHKIA